MAASLRGDRSIHRDGLGEQGRPRCPWCCTPLRPGRMLSGWAPRPRRRTHACLECDGGWAVVDKPGELVDALAAYWSARNGPTTAEHLAAVVGRARELHLELPDDTGADHRDRSNRVF